MTEPSVCTPFWIDFNVTCPTGNMILVGSWTDNVSGGFPTLVRITSNGTLLASSGGNPPWYGTGNASWGSFDVTAHETVTFQMYSVWNMNQEISIAGERHSWSIIL